MLGVDLTQCCDRLFRQPIRQVLPFRIATKVLEPQHGQRRSLWRGLHRHRQRPAALDVRNKPIALPGSRRDVTVLAPGLTQNSTQSRNVLVEIVLLDTRVRPDRLHELVFLDDSLSVLYKVQQRVEGLRRERNGRASTQEQALPDLDTEFSEFVNAWLWAAHDRAFISFQDISAPF